MDCLSHININTAVSILGTNKCIPSARCDKYSHPKAAMHIHVVPLGVHYYSCWNTPCTHAQGDVAKYMLCVNVLCLCVCVLNIVKPVLSWFWMCFESDAVKKTEWPWKHVVFFLCIYIFLGYMFSFFCSRFCSSENYRSSSKKKKILFIFSACQWEPCLSSAPSYRWMLWSGFLLSSWWKSETSSANLWLKLYSGSGLFFRRCGKPRNANVVPAATSLGLTEPHSE